MNDIKQLEERIAQLTELVKTGSEAIKNMETALKAAEEERDRLADQRRESEPKFERVENREYYWSVGTTFVNEGKATACRHYENFDRGDNNYFNNNNYFKTVQRADEVADKINFLLKLERLHDTFCPEYVPDWENCWLSKYYIYQDKSMGNIWIWGQVNTDSDVVQVYFPTEEIAQKVCDILNAEERSKDK
jgi:hypothetical protein